MNDEGGSKIVRADRRRFKDADAAQMYQRAGYTEVQRDNFVFRPLLGLERRFLMTKLLLDNVTDV